MTGTGNVLWRCWLRRVRKPVGRFTPKRRAIEALLLEQLSLVCESCGQTTGKVEYGTGDGESGLGAREVKGNEVYTEDRVLELGTAARQKELNEQ
jgi:hypothetical protein